MGRQFRAVEAALAFVTFARANPRQSLQLLALGMLPAIALPLSEPVFALLFLVSAVLLPAAWWRVIMGRTDPASRFPLQVSHDEVRVNMGILLISGIATLAAMIPHLIVMLLYLANPSVEMLLLTIVSLTVAPGFVWARLGPSLALAVAERRFLVTRSWQPTGQIGWKLNLAWLPVLALWSLPTAFSLMQQGPVPQEPVYPVWQIAVVLGPVWTFALAFICATHAYVARHIQQVAHDAEAVGPA